MAVYVTVNERNIMRDFLPGGQVYRNMNSMRRRNEFNAQRLSPTRTGALANSINSEMELSTPPYRCAYEVYSELEHAHYVLGGTTGPIRSSRPGGAMLVRPFPASWYGEPALRRSVDGQDANNFFSESMITTLAMEGLL